jgi:hypothetical protein
MKRPLIAIVGSYDPGREQELGLKNLSLAPKAGEFFGKTFATSGFHIVVYASYPYMLEVDVVKGYCSVKGAEPGSIHVYYSQKYDRPAFPEENSNPELFRFYPDLREDWEISFYHSLSTVDGILILGGGHSTLVGGLVAIGHKKPIIACAGFGGSGLKVWDAIPTQDYMLSPDDKFLMAEQRWALPLAEQLTKILQKQIEEFQSVEKRRLEAERDSILQKVEEGKRRDKNITIHALVAAFVFILSAVMWIAAWGMPNLSVLWLWTFLIGAPLLTGISGATIRVVFDWMQGTTKRRQPSLVGNAVLGLISGGITAFLFIIAQVFSNPAAIEPTVGSETLRRLLPFTLTIGFVAGLTLDAVYTRLQETNVVNTSSIKPKEE